ncbi:MAG: TraR/DksA C4-type zinc finger protein [Actinomycetota bacterium]|nr:TraR/DksA C4-type zinc finger protein [Actinomycetota bacterium]
MGSPIQVQLAAERARAETLISDLKLELAAIAESTAAGPDDEHDAEGSTVGYERARVQALLAHAERAAAEIAAAAERAETGDGTLRCQRCHFPIPFERLIALPATRTCVTCAA